MQVGARIPVGIQLQKAAVGPTSVPTWRLSHLGDDHVRAVEVAELRVPDVPGHLASRVEVVERRVVAL